MFRLLCSGKMMKSLNGSTLKTNVRCFGDDPPRMERSTECFLRLTHSTDVHLFEVITFFTAINSIQILGRVGVEPQQRGTEQHPVVTFTVATHTNFKWMFPRFSVLLFPNLSFASLFSLSNDIGMRITIGHSVSIGTKWLCSNRHCVRRRKTIWRKVNAYW